MIELDGTYGEGGGQMLRCALALSCLTRQPFRMTAVRQGRNDPGVKAQHVSAVRALLALSDATAEGVSLGAKTVTFRPAPIRGRTLSIDVETAGCLPLLLQALLLPCCFADDKIRLKLKGGTDVRWGPTLDFFRELVLPHYQALADIKLELVRRGFYPGGAGRIELTIRPRFSVPDDADWSRVAETVAREVSPLALDSSGTVHTIYGRSIASNELRAQEVAERQVRGAKAELKELGRTAKITKEYVDTKSIGTVITLWLSRGSNELPCISGSALGEKGKRAEIVGAEAASDLVRQITPAGGIDARLADQLLPLLALVGGSLTINAVTPHIQSSVYAINAFLPDRLKHDGCRLWTHPEQC
ncbi:MAG: RNA 3'-phosphate cyclase [Bdellovibrionales bacterium]|nr:RNA 3'-phosphate cyclase [Bdellovibrionales bacterium]